MNTRQVPATLERLPNAKRCNVPALFLVSRDDRIVPPTYQRQVIDAYQGKKEVLSIAGGHDERRLCAADELLYLQAIRTFHANTIGSMKL